jgi:hypothetical protein
MSLIVWLMRDGTPYDCELLDDVQCPMCGHVGAIVSLPPPLKEKQPDGTTHVCHPACGGCNHGFAHELERENVH